MARPRRPENEAGTCLLFAGVLCVAAVDDEEAISQEGERMPRKVAHCVTSSPGPFMHSKTVEMQLLWK